MGYRVRIGRMRGIVILQSVLLLEGGASSGVGQGGWTPVQLSHGDLTYISLICKGREEKLEKEEIGCCPSSSSLRPEAD